MAVRNSTTKMPQAAVLKQILKKCPSIRRRSLNWSGVENGGLPKDILRGHFSVYVGKKRSRHIVPISWLGHPEFQYLLHTAEEEYGFSHDMSITIPCEEAVLRSSISFLVQ